MNRDIYQAITERFVEQLKHGTVPWQNPWFAVQNIVSRKPYRGINALDGSDAEKRRAFWQVAQQMKRRLELLASWLPRSGSSVASRSITTSRVFLSRVPTPF
jgi:antirestriction protein ArdC